MSACATTCRRPATHLRDAHGLGEPERWPDGAIVVHAPDVEPCEVTGRG